VSLKIGFRDAVLAAVAAGAESVGEIADALMVEEAAVERVVEELKSKGLVIEVEKGFWIFKKKVLRLTEVGRLRAEEVLRYLRELAAEVREKVGSSSRAEEVREIIEPYGPVLPLLLYLGLLDLMLFESMLFMPLLAWGLSDFGGDTVVE